MTTNRTLPRRTLIAAAALLAATAGLIAALPALETPAAHAGTGAGNGAAPTMHPGSQGPNAQPVVEAVFVLDTTGSMGGLIQAAKDKIWSIATTMAGAEPAPRLRIGLVGFRDRGDDYVTRIVDLSPDLDGIHAALSQFEANGGGDGPESVNQALAEAVSALSWGDGANAYRVIFLVGDAPPHLDYDADTAYADTLRAARQRGIRVNAIQCGDDADTRTHWQRIAQLGAGAYLRVDQDGGAVAIATPYDDALARLAADLDATRLYYGSRAERAERAREVAAADAAKAAAPAPVLARRATFAASASGKAAVLGERELVDEVASGRLDLESVAADELPEPLQGLSADAQRQVVADTAARREALTRQIADTAAKRERWLGERVEASGGAAGSLDQGLFDAVREQAAGAGLHYRRDAPAY